MVRFLLVSTQRSGTRFFRSALDSHPSIRCRGEMFYSSVKGGYYELFFSRLKRDPSWLYYKKSYQLLCEYLENYFTNNAEDAVGLELKYDQFNTHAKMLEALLNANVTIIHLVRRNVLKTHVSSLLNSQKKSLRRKAHSTSPVPIAKIRVPVGALLLRTLEARTKNIQYHRHRMAQNFPYLEVKYEDLCDLDRPQVISSRVLKHLYRFLGVTPEIDLFSPYVKMNPQCLKDSVENYQELYEFLALHGWQHLLDS